MTHENVFFGGVLPGWSICSGGSGHFAPAKVVSLNWNGVVNLTGLCSSGPFKVILGDETMYTSDYTDFKELAFAVYEDFENAFRSITGD